MKLLAVLIILMLAGCTKQIDTSPHREAPARSTVLRDSQGRAWIVINECFGRSCPLARVPEVDTPP